MMKRAVILLLICLSNGWLFANHWTPDNSIYEDNMTLTGVIHINGVEQQSTTLEVGVFCEEECRGSGLLTYFFPTQRYVVQLLIFGESGDRLTFKLYDHTLSQELNLVPQETVTFTANGYGSLFDPYILNFSGSNNHWMPNESGYEDNMTLTGVIHINGVEQQSTTLEVGVFCEEECRGSGLLTYFFPTQRYVVQLLIYGEAGNQLTFKLYDHAVGQELDLTSPDAVTFVANGYGSLANPYVLNFESGGITQTIELVQGWNWFSTYVEIGNPVEMLQTLEAALGENATEIQAFEIFTEYEDGEWWGDLDEIGITNEQTYMIYVANDCTVQLQGLPANPANHAIEIKPGWNWIGFPSAVAMDIADALANFEAEVGDMIQASTIFTEFDGEEWFGDIAKLLPGQGYMYYSNSSETKYLVFPTSTR